MKWLKDIILIIILFAIALAIANSIAFVGEFIAYVQMKQREINLNKF